MRETPLPPGMPVTEATSFAACVATILELPLADVPIPADGESLVDGTTRRWLGGLGLGPIEVRDAPAFKFAGAWIGLVRAAGERRAVVMFGVPAGVAFDPTGVTDRPGRGDAGAWTLEAGIAIAALDIALARPAMVAAPATVGVVESLWVAPAAGEPARSLTSARAIAGLGLDGDRHVLGTGTFASRVPGSALTLIAAEVCDSFAPPLGPDEHRRNVVTRGIDLNALVGREFAIGAVVCRGTRLCEPCIVIERYAKRKILRPLVHRGGIRADILVDGELRVGDRVGVR